MEPFKHMQGLATYDKMQTMDGAERDRRITQAGPWLDGPRAEPGTRGQLTSCAQAEKFMLAGNATITVVSNRTQKRLTFKVTKPQDFNENRPIWFVSVLKGQNNEGDFGYMGQIMQRGADYWYSRGRKCWREFFKASDAFAWVWETVTINPTRMDTFEVWHEGKCGRCGRKLTIPESIESGFGPECIGKI